MTIDFTKPVQTRDGQPVTILTTERASSTYPVVGLLKDEIIHIFTDEGRFNCSGHDHKMDLMNVPVRHTREVWLNVYPGNIGIVAHETRAIADEYTSSKRIACIPVTIEFEEGEGL